MTVATANKRHSIRGVRLRGGILFRGSETMATATRQMRDRVERIMKEGLACDCCSAEIKALFTEWIENRECTLKTKEIADKLIPLMEKCVSLFSADAIEAPLELLHIWHYNPAEDGQVLKAANTDGKEEIKVSNGFHLDSKEPDWSKLLTASNLEKKVFAAEAPRLGYAYAATFRQCSSKLGTALNFRSSHHGRGPLQLADEDLLHWIRFNSTVFSSPYGVPAGGRRTLRRYGKKCKTPL